MLFLMISTLFASAQRVGNWEKLGQQTVNFKTEKDVIRASHKGTFSKIRIRVDGNDVEFHKVLVRFNNGSTQEISLRNVIPAGGESRVIDLNGNKRVIREVVFYYKTVSRNGGRNNDRHHHNRPNNNHKRKATVSVWGRH